MSIAGYYREWLRKSPNEPADRMEMALAAISAFEECERKRQAIAPELAALVRAARSPHKLVFETGCKLLVHLAERQTEAQRCIRDMAQDKNATARFHAVAYLDHKLPEELRLQVVGLALRDRSAKVRLKGIEGAERFKFTQFLSQLEQMQRSETNKGVCSALALHVPLLRDGFLLEPSEDGAGYYLTVRGPRSLGGPFIPKEQFSKAFVLREVARLQAGGA
jgi:hypothetical protein